MKRSSGETVLIIKSCGCMPDDYVDELKIRAKKEFGDFVIEYSGDVMKNESYAIAKEKPQEKVLKAEDDHRYKA